MTAPFQLEHGVVAFGPTTVLEDVTVQVGDGEFVALLGANGSGKTTLVRTLVGLQPLAGGDLRVFGTPIAAFREWPRVGYVPQRHVVAGGLPATVREVVGSGRTARGGWWRRPGEPDRKAVEEALVAVGLADRGPDRIATLSGGQQQRAHIARALAQEPDVLVLDEPTAGVDDESQHAFTETLRMLKETGHTVLLVTHHLGPLASLVDRAVVLSSGHVVHDGPIPPGGMPLGDVHADDHHHPAERSVGAPWRLG